jgi:hypothetical protein
MEKAEISQLLKRGTLLESVQNIPNYIKELVSARPSTSYILMLVSLLFDPRLNENSVPYYQNFIEDFLQISC